MKTTKLVTALVIAAGLGGCALNQGDAAAKLNETHPIRCADKAACDRMWSKLQAGIDEMTAHKFMERTPTQLRQFVPVMESVYPFVNRATRVNAPDGSAVITLDIWCANPFGCARQGPEALGMALREYIARPD